MMKSRTKWRLAERNDDWANEMVNRPNEMVNRPNEAIWAPKAAVAFHKYIPHFILIEIVLIIALPMVFTMVRLSSSVDSIVLCWKPIWPNRGRPRRLSPNLRNEPSIVGFHRSCSDCLWWRLFDVFPLHLLNFSIACMYLVCVRMTRSYLYTYFDFIKLKNIIRFIKNGIDSDDDGRCRSKRPRFYRSIFLFSSLRSDDIEKERNKHDLALEQLTNARDEWSKERC